MDKARNKHLMELADQILCDSEHCPLYKDNDRTTIHDSYNGQVSALGISILMIGLRPTLSVYYLDKKSDNPNVDKAYRRAVLEVIARMLHKDGNSHFTNAESLVRYVLSPDAEDLKTQILDCSVALKQVVRTYKLG